MKTILQISFFFLLVTQICFAQWVQTSLDTCSVTSFAVSETNLFAGTHYCEDYSCADSVFLSTDNGTSWNLVNSGLPYYPVWALAVSGTNLFAGTGPGGGVDGLGYINNGTNEAGVYLSTNNGTSWTAVNSGLPGSVSSLCAMGANLFAGTDGHGVFLSTNNGSSWNAVNTGLMDSSVSVLAVSGTYLFTGTYYSGVWRRPLSEMITDVEDIGQLPREFLLSQNYPNPFNPSTKIKYSVPQASNVVIKVFDMLGDEIETLVNEEKPVGTYEIAWYAESLPSGVYFYQLRAGSIVETKKMLLLK